MKPTISLQRYNDGEFEQAFAVFNRNEQATYDLVRNQVGLSEEKAHRMLEDDYRFFCTINRPNEVACTLKRQCRER